MRPYGFSFVLFLICSLMWQGCDILRSSPFEVVSWIPGEGTHPGFTGPAIVLEFSHESDRYSVERSFTCTEDGLSLRGTFSWEGKRLSFFPAAGIQMNRDYRIQVATDAQDKEGLSLENAFEGHFSTRPSGNRMRLIGSTPADGGLLTSSEAGPCRESIILTFSKSVKLDSLYQYVSFTPSIPGLWQLESEGTIARFTPGQSWQNGKTYTCSISRDLTDSNDLSMGQAYTIHFTVGSDREPPFIQVLQSVNREGNPVQNLLYAEFEGESGPAEMVPVNEQFEVTYGIVLEFSEPVDPAILKNKIVFQPGLNFTLSPLYPPSNRYWLRFTDKPLYGTQYTLSVNRGIPDLAGNTSTKQVLCSLLVNGSHSKLPRFIGFRIPLAPGATAGNEEPVVFSMEDAFQNLSIQPGSTKYPFDIPTTTWIEFYFDVASGAHINLFSLMNSFTLTATNSALSFAPRSVSSTTYTWADPVPGWEDYERVEVRGLLTNGTNSGVVNISFLADLADSLGNVAGSTQNLPFIK